METFNLAGTEGIRLSQPRHLESQDAGDWIILESREPLTKGFSRAVWPEGHFNVSADRVSSAKFQISYAGIADFLIDFTDKVVRVCRAAKSSEHSIRHLLGDQIIPRILAHQGELVLHAAGVQGDEGMVLFVGTSGSGKSTLAASLHNGGYHLIGDDAIVISMLSGTIVGQAIYRSLRLFPDSIETLVRSSSAAQLTPVASYTAKQNVMFPDDNHSAEPLPIRAAFLLDPPRDDSIVVESMASSEACMAFVEHSFWMDPTDLARTKERMVKASELAERVRTFRVAFPRDYVALPAVHEALVAALD